MRIIFGSKIELYSPPSERGGVNTGEGHRFKFEMHPSIFIYTQTCPILQNRTGLKYGLSSIINCIFRKSFFIEYK